MFLCYLNCLFLDLVILKESREFLKWNFFRFCYVGLFNFYMC